MQKKQVLAAIIALVTVSIACHRASSPSKSQANSASPTAQQITLMNDLRKLAETQCGTKADKIDVDASLLTVGCDELDVVELIMTVEEKYNVPIPDMPGESVTIKSLAQTVSRR